MKRSTTLLLLGIALVTGAVAAGVALLAGLELAYVPVVGLAGFAVALAAAFAALLPPAEEPKPVARARPADASALTAPAPGHRVSSP